MNTGTHTVGETAGTTTDLADYQKSISCVDTANGNASVASTTGDSAGPLTVPVTTGSDIVCTITNTRETGKLEVRKDLEPERRTPACSTSRSTARPTPTRRTSATAARPARRRSTPATTPSARRPAPTPTSADYQKSIVCKDDNGTGSMVAETTGDDAGPLTVPVTTGSDIVCVITNTRETGKLEVTKALSPSTDPGLFNLQIDGTTDADAAERRRRRLDRRGDARTPATTPSARRPAPTPTSPTTRSRSSARTTTAPASIVAQTTGDDGGPLTVPVTTDSDIVCVITNTRETGKLEVSKDLEPDTDAGLFNLQIDGIDRPRRDRTSATAASTGEETAEHRQPHRRRDRRHRTPTWPTTRSRSSARTTTAPARSSPDHRRRRRPADRPGHHGRRHRLRDHQHP